MPTYEYRCVMGHTFEEFQSMVAAPLEVCPICGAKAERQISAGSGLIFKGSGFYITDYGKKNISPTERAKRNSDEEKPSVSKTETKSEITSSDTPKDSAGATKEGSS
jgi:putative FmdB family regulatory protein